MHCLPMPSLAFVILTVIMTFHNIGNILLSKVIRCLCSQASVSLLKNGSKLETSVDAVCAGAQVSGHVTAMMNLTGNKLNTLIMCK